MFAAAIVVTLIVAMIDWFSKLTANAQLETVAKPLTTVLVMWIAVAADGPTAPTVLAVIGLVFCLIGDIALLDAIDNFVLGLASFLVAHLLFIAMFVALGLDDPAWGIAVAILLAAYLFTVAPRIVAGAVRTDPSLRVPVIVYQAVISAMTVVATMTGEPWAIFGAVAFVVSDSVLAWRAFVVDHTVHGALHVEASALDEAPPSSATATPWMAVIVMITYHAAIIGLALSLH